MCGVTPRQQLVLPVDPSAAAAARTWLRVVHCAAHGESLLEDARLLVSELVSNAVRYGGPPIVLAVDCDETRLSVRVRDGNPALPVPARPDVGAESGRGFVLLDLLTERWGVEAAVDGEGGKEVWFLLGG